MALRTLAAGKTPALRAPDYIRSAAAGDANGEGCANPIRSKRHSERALRQFSQLSGHALEAGHALGFSCAARLRREHQGAARVDGRIEARRDVGGGALLDDECRALDGDARRESA